MKPKKSSLPKPVSPLSRWCYENDMTSNALGLMLGKSSGMANLYLKPFDHEAYVEPPIAQKKIIFIMSDGQVTPNDLVPLNDWKEELAQERALEEDAA